MGPLTAQSSKNSHMKIALLVPEFPTQTHIFFWREARALRRLGVDVSFISTRRPVAPCPHEFAAEIIPQTFYLYPPKIAAVALQPLGIVRGTLYAARLADSGWKNRARVAAMSLTAANLAAYCRKRGIEHIHVHSCAHAAHVAAMAFRMGGPTYSLRLHGDLPVYGTDHASKMRDALFVCAVAQPHRQQILDKVGIPAERVCTIPMGVDTDRFTPNPNLPFSNNSSPLRVVTVARLDACKGHVFALRAIRRAIDSGTNINFAIAGRGDAELEIRAEIERLGLGQHVRILGSLDESRVIELLQQSDVFLLSSIGIGEASPVSVMEAMACGVPPVCSIIGGTCDMITHDVDGILTPQRDEAAIADALQFLAANPHKRATMAAAARERAIRQFSIDLSARRLLETITTQQSAYTKNKSN